MRRARAQRIHAILFHHGLPRVGGLLTGDRRAWLERVPLQPAAREAVAASLRMIDRIGEELAPLDRHLASYAARQPGCQALQGRYGIGPVTATAILAELGDPRRFSSSRHAVRHAGLDITVSASDMKRAPGRLSRQGPELPRWAAYEAAKSSYRETSPDYPYYVEVKARVGGSRATLSVARRILRWAYHTLRDLGDEALRPPAPEVLSEAS